MNTITVNKGKIFHQGINFSLSENQINNLKNKEDKANVSEKEYNRLY